MKKQHMLIIGLAALAAFLYYRWQKSQAVANSAVETALDVLQS